ncbi:MAG TPA: metal-sensing transcriptional repressor [Tissierellaceae bacterium]
MNAGKEKALNKLKTARGQIDGIIRMIEDDRYCIDISTQVLSVIGLLKKSNLDILDGHLKSCVTDAIIESEDSGEDKINEVMNIIERYVR